jgi:ABC-type uncharacterized transport system permease subunit
MKKLSLVVFTTLITVTLLIVANGFSFSNEQYVNKNVIDLSEPFNGRIDVSYLKEIYTSHTSVFDVK